MPVLLLGRPGRDRCRRVGYIWFALFTKLPERKGPSRNAGRASRPHKDVLQWQTDAP